MEIPEGYLGGRLKLISSKGRRVME